MPDLLVGHAYLRNRKCDSNVEDRNVVEASTVA